MIKKDLIIAVLLTFCITVTLFGIVPTSGQEPGDYDPWYDINDDGKIDMRDVGGMARKFGTSGNPINKTFVLLEVQRAVGIVNQTLEARIPQREVISIPAAAFVPEDEIGIDHYSQNRGIYLANRNDSRAAYFYAPVQLAHGVNITRVYMFWYDNGTSSIRLYLTKNNHSTTPVLMVSLESPLASGPGEGSSNDNNIIDPIIDNYSYYYLALWIPPSPTPEKFVDYYFYYAIIEYEYLE